MDERKKKLGILNEFFADVNVRFPKYPKLVKGIHVYEAPKGLGIQFRGGTEKFLIKGATAYKIWDFIKNDLDGGHTLDEILTSIQKQGLDGIEVGSFLKTLHSYHLLEPDPIADAQEKGIHFDLFSDKQVQFYNRMVPNSGLNKDGKEVLFRIRKSKILIISNEIIVPIVSYQLQMAGFTNIGFLVISDEQSTMAHSYITDNVNVMTYVDIRHMQNKELRNVYGNKFSDYQYILTVVNNPCIHFLNEICRFCTIFNKPMLSISIKENEYEVGPFYFPETDSSCITCYNLREQSYRHDSVYDFIYQEGLNAEHKKYDNEIMGFDLNALTVVLNIAILQLKNALTSVAQPKLIGAVFKFNALNYKTELINVIKVPGCPSCCNINQK